MSKIINENIRFYKETDPYYWEVDNLPLQDLLANDKELEEAIHKLVEVKIMIYLRLRMV